VELGLRVFGYGYPTSFFMKMEGGKTYTVNENFARQFYDRKSAAGKTHPFLMPAEKQAGTIRIFILGESAAQGSPNPAFGFSRILEFMLRSQYPSRRFEVINAAMKGINSHIVLPIARDCARRQPDLFIVYMGNNEAVGLHAPGPDTGVFHRNLTLIRAVQCVRSTRLGQWLAVVIAKMGRDHSGEHDMEFFRAHRTAPDDFRRAAVCTNFRANLREMCELMPASGARVLLSTIAVNLKDFPPLGSLHRASLTEPEKARWEAEYAKGIAAETDRRHDEAIQHYLDAVRLDDHFAELHFRLARCYFASERFEQAREHFILARDWDALQFRTDQRLNATIRDVAAANRARGIELVDAEKAFAQSQLSDHQIPGDTLFYEHVHLRFDGDYLLARTLYPAVVAALGSALGRPSETTPPLSTPQECRERLALTSWDELQMDLSMLKMTAQPPFLDQVDHAQRQAQAEERTKSRRTAFQKSDLQQSLETYRAALARAPDDWELHHNFGTFCYLIGDYSGAASHLEFEVKTFPTLLAGHVALGAALAKGGQAREAVVQFYEALRIDPDYTPAQEAIAALTARWQGKAAPDPKIKVPASFGAEAP
jgi:tetratricopeptide (TPR) repeat protein